MLFWNINNFRNRRRPMIAVPLSRIHEKSKSSPKGYLDEIINSGKIKGGFILLEESVFLELKKKYNPKGFGDTVERFAKPIARAVDSVLGTNLVNCGSCEERKEFLNKVFPTKG